MSKEENRSASGEWVTDAFSRYQQAATGLRQYWYPVMRTSELKQKPVRVVIAGQELVLARGEDGQPRVLQDRCAHRGVPLSQGEVIYPGTISCPYHGFTYDMANGQLVSVLTDRPDSPICGKASVAVRAYPAADRAGMVWVYAGDASQAPPVDQDVPAELLAQDAIVIPGRISVQEGNWRMAAEAGIDESHARYLHRTSLWMLFRKLDAWTEFEMNRATDGGWLYREVKSVTAADQYPVGRWPLRKMPFYRGWGQPPREIGIRLPGVLRAKWKNWFYYEFYVPVSQEQRLEILVMATWGGRLRKFLFKAYYALILQWVYNRNFHDQDNWIIPHMQIPPERLFGPDKSVTAWRKMLENEARDWQDGDDQAAEASSASTTAR